MPVTTTELVAQIRLTSDLKASRFWEDADILQATNDSLAELYDILVQAREGYFQTSALLALVSNSSNLPTDFYKELGLSAGNVDAHSAWRIPPLESFNDRFDSTGYWIASRVLTVYPTNIAPPVPVTLTYVPNCPVLLLADPIPVDLERFREYLAVSVSIKIKNARAQDAT